MKIKFLQRRMDKHTNEIYEVDTVKEFEDARANEILATGCAVKVQEKKTKPKTKKVKA